MKQDTAERLAEYVRRVVDAAPPLTVGQREKLTAILSSPQDVYSTPLCADLK